MSTASARDRLVRLVERTNVAVSVAGLLLVWLALDRSDLVGSLPGPVVVAGTMGSLLMSPAIRTPVETSLFHVFSSFLVATAIGVPLGLAIGWSTPVRDLVFPSLEVLRPVPPISWIPLTVLVLPTVQTSIVFITFLGAFFPILLNTIRGVRDVEYDYVRAVRSLGGSKADVFRNVVYPGALPSIRTGLVTGMGLAWVNLVAAEMIGNNGLGRFVWVSYASGSYPDIVAGVAIIGALGYASSQVVRWISGTQLRWNRQTDV